MKSTINNLISRHDALKKCSGVLDFTNRSVVAVENARPRG